MNNQNYYCVILAGGIGMRLWPTSRQQRPKQFIDFFGRGETLLQMTYRRFARFLDPNHIIVLTNCQYADLVKEQLPVLPAENVLYEPMRRNTVPSVTWASVEIERRNPNACIIVSPADQLISDDDLFPEDMLNALDYVGRRQRLLTLGVFPSRAETAYGYIQMAEKMEETFYHVQSFTEKPELEFAKMFLESREFLWNTGLFVFHVQTYLKEMQMVPMDFVQMIETAEQRGEEGKDFYDLVEDSFSKCPNVSLEQGILEKSENVDVMLCHFGWADLGTWGSLHKALPKNADNNVVMSADHTMLYDCKNCLVKLSPDRVAVIQGLDDYMVVEQDGVLVICRKDDPGEIRKFVNDVQLTLGEQYV